MISKDAAAPLIEAAQRIYDSHRPDHGAWDRVLEGPKRNLQALEMSIVSDPRDSYDTRQSWWDISGGFKQETIWDKIMFSSPAPDPAPYDAIAGALYETEMTELKDISDRYGGEIKSVGKMDLSDESVTLSCELYANHLTQSMDILETAAQRVGCQVPKEAVVVADYIHGLHYRICGILEHNRTLESLTPTDYCQAPYDRQDQKCCTGHMAQRALTDATEKAADYMRRSDADPGFDLIRMDGLRKDIVLARFGPTGNLYPITTTGKRPEHIEDTDLRTLGESVLKIIDSNLNASEVHGILCALPIDRIKTSWSENSLENKYYRRYAPDPLRDSPLFGHLVSQLP